MKLGGQWLSVLWQVIDWEIEEPLPTSHADLVWPRTGVHGVLLNKGDFGQNLSVASGKIDGQNPSCGTIRVETPKMITVPIVSFKKFIVPEGMREESSALVRDSVHGLEVTRAIYICDKLTFIEKVSV